MALSVRSLCYLELLGFGAKLYTRRNYVAKIQTVKVQQSHIKVQMTITGKEDNCPHCKASISGELYLELRSCSLREHQDSATLLKQLTFAIIWAEMF